MNLSPEALEQVLTGLADRADAHPVADRVPAVHRRARRNARRRNGALAALTVLIVLAAGFAGLPLLRGHGPDPADPPAPTGPYLSIQLVRDEAKEGTLTPRVSGGRVVAVTVTLHGRVPRGVNYRAGADVRDNLREATLFVDGADKEVKVRPLQPDLTCDPGAPLVDVDTSFPMVVTFRPDGPTPMLGPHELRFTTTSCAPVNVVQQKLTVVVK